MDDVGQPEHDQQCAGHVSNDDAGSRSAACTDLIHRLHPSENFHACKKCNNARSSTPYAMQHSYNAYHDGRHATVKRTCRAYTPRYLPYHRAVALGGHYAASTRSTAVHSSLGCTS